MATNKQLIFFLVYSLSLLSVTFGDEFDDSPLSHNILGENGLEVNHEKGMKSVTVVPGLENKTHVVGDYEIPTETSEQHGFTQSPEIVEEGEGGEPVTEKATWHINQYMPGCDHDVRDCLDAALQLNNPEGVTKDTLLLDCMDAHDCMPLKRWACDSNINFVNRHTLVTERCLKWGLYQYQEQTATEEQEVEREL